MRKLAFQPSDADPGNTSRRNSLRRHATPDFLLASPADREYSQVTFPFAHRGSACLSSPSPDLPSFHFAGAAWPRAESAESEYSGEDNESSLDHGSSSGEDYDGVDMDAPGSGQSVKVVSMQQSQVRPSPQVSLHRRGSQDSVTGALRVTRPVPATPRIVHHSLPPLGYTPAPTGADASVFAASVKHGRPLEAMCVDPFERKKRRVAASVSEIGRFRTDFTDVSHIGKGSFSDVFRVKHRLDGQLYALKRLKKQCTTDSERHRWEKEAKLHALLTQYADRDPLNSCFIVRYYSSWFEDGRLFLQTEYCPSTLPDVIADTGGPLDEQVILSLLSDVASGLRFLHANSLVHLDIKPANILVSTCGCFKICDLGLVSEANAPSAEVTSGDARYLPREILLNNFNFLPKADVFSLGATALECMLGIRLEAEGEDWHMLRDGHLPVNELGRYSDELIGLVSRMMAPDPVQRPSCEDVLAMPAVSQAKPASRSASASAVPAPAQTSSPEHSIVKSIRDTRHKLRKLFTSTM